MIIVSIILGQSTNARFLALRPNFSAHKVLQIRVSWVYQQDKPNDRADLWEALCDLLLLFYAMQITDSITCMRSGSHGDDDSYYNLLTYDNVYSDGRVSTFRKHVLPRRPQYELKTQVPNVPQLI